MGDRRLVRSDKKVDVKPTISENVKTPLYRLSEILHSPVKDVAEQLCIDASLSPIIIGEMKQWFRREYNYNVTWVIGDPERPPLRVRTDTFKGKVTIKFHREDYDQICKLAFALDLTPTTTCAVLLMLTLRSKQFMQWYLGVNHGGLNEIALRDINKLLKS